MFQSTIQLQSAVGKIIVLSKCTRHVKIEPSSQPEAYLPVAVQPSVRKSFAVVSVVLSCGLCILYLYVWVCLMFFLLANKKRLVLHDVVQHLHWLLTRELLHQIVRS